MFMTTQQKSYHAGIFSLLGKFCDGCRFLLSQYFLKCFLAILQSRAEHRNRDSDCESTHFSSQAALARFGYRCAKRVSHVRFPGEAVSRGTSLH